MDKLSDTWRWTIGGGSVGVILGLIAGVGAAIVNEGTAGDLVASLAAWVSLLGLTGAAFGFMLDRDGKKQAKLVDESLAEEKEERARLAYEEHQHRVEAQRQRDADLKDWRDRLDVLVSSSQNTFAEIRDLVLAADRHLDRAEWEFSEGAFGPFWDEIENATNKLAKYQLGVQSISDNARRYNQGSDNPPTISYANIGASQLLWSPRELGFREAGLPGFDLPAWKLPDARPTAIRLGAIVRPAQKEPNFAMIYQQFKTNQILVKGFNTLASAIYDIGDSLSFSLNELSNDLHTSLDQLLEATRESSREIQAASETHTEIHEEQAKQAAAEAEKRRRFEKEVIGGQQKQEEMLDNIQRGRKPRS